MRAAVGREGALLEPLSGGSKGGGVASAFLVVQSSESAITVTTHNKHNGHYGGFGLRAKFSAPNARREEDGNGNI